ncbi:TPA: hypothetical protein ACT5B2_006806 [Burkholderia cenocepacia]|uniref:hypothetical protein n=1 Tax=Burkholderia cenocepacia TaxID=95486 RepID=UPI002AB69C7F|nr:hypothetical protein [Burkholderia cenocepacia]
MVAKQLLVPDNAAVPAPYLTRLQIKSNAKIYADAFVDRPVDLEAQSMVSIRHRFCAGNNWPASSLRRRFEAITPTDQDP